MQPKEKMVQPFMRAMPYGALKFPKKKKEKFNLSKYKKKLKPKS